MQLDGGVILVPPVLRATLARGKLTPCNIVQCSKDKLPHHLGGIETVVEPYGSACAAGAKNDVKGVLKEIGIQDKSDSWRPPEGFA